MALSLIACGGVVAVRDGGAGGQGGSAPTCASVGIGEPCPDDAGLCGRDLDGGARVCCATAVYDAGFCPGP